MSLHLIRSRVAASPRPALVLGKTLFLVGAVMIVAAVFARAGIIAPSLVAWLVPHGPVGYALAAGLVLAGMYLVAVAGNAIKDNSEKRKANW